MKSILNFFIFVSLASFLTTGISKAAFTEALKSSATIFDSTPDKLQVKMPNAPRNFRLLKFSESTAFNICHTKLLIVWYEHCVLYSRVNYYT